VNMMSIDYRASTSELSLLLFLYMFIHCLKNFVIFSSFLSKCIIYKYVSFLKMEIWRNEEKSMNNL